MDSATSSRPHAVVRPFTPALATLAFAAAFASCSIAAQPRGSAMPSAAAAFAPPRVPDEAEIRAAGWTPAEAPPEPWEVVDPLVPVQRGVALLVRDPDALPRPVAVRGERRLSLPLAARQSLMERQEGAGGAAVLRWTPRFEITELGAETVLLSVDVRPFRQSGPPDQLDIRAAFRNAERQMAESVMSASNNIQVDPGRRFRLEPRPPSGPPPDLPSGVRLVRMSEGIAEDALLVSFGGDGSDWWRLELSEEAREIGTHRLAAESVFGLGEDLVVAPQPRAPDAALELIAFEGADREPRHLPFPRPKGAPWRCEVSDLLRRGEILEALVLVHDPNLRRGPERPPADSWAARLRFVDGAWVDERRIPLPGDARALRLRFDRERPDQLRLEHDRRLLARRPVELP